jgi:hypothetical protein
VGLWVFFGPRTHLIGLIVLGVIAYLALRVGRSLMSRDPVSGRLLIELWIIAAIVVGALATTVILWWTLDANLTWLAPAKLLAAKSGDQIRGVVTGAVSAFFAAAITKEIGEGKGAFSVAMQFKAALAALSGTLSPAPTGRLLDALVHEAIENERERGWGFAARGVRARVISEEL